jgi:hypothetical protein
VTNKIVSPYREKPGKSGLNGSAERRKVKTIGKIPRRI